LEQSADKVGPEDVGSYVIGIGIGGDDLEGDALSGVSGDVGVRNDFSRWWGIDKENDNVNFDEIGELIDRLTVGDSVIELGVGIVGWTEGSSGWSVKNTSAWNWGFGANQGWADGARWICSESSTSEKLSTIDWGDQESEFRIEVINIGSQELVDDDVSVHDGICGKWSGSWFVIDIGNGESDDCGGRIETSIKYGIRERIHSEEIGGWDKNNLDLSSGGRKALWKLSGSDLVGLDT
jgi:hypothetical protein